MSNLEELTTTVHEIYNKLNSMEPYLHGTAGYADVQSAIIGIERVEGRLTQIEDRLRAIETRLLETEFLTAQDLDRAVTAAVPTTSRPGLVWHPEGVRNLQGQWDLSPLHQPTRYFFMAVDGRAYNLFEPICHEWTLHDLQLYHAESHHHNIPIRSYQLDNHQALVVQYDSDLPARYGNEWHIRDGRLYMTSYWGTVYMAENPHGRQTQGVIGPLHCKPVYAEHGSYWQINHEAERAREALYRQFLAEHQARGQPPLSPGLPPQPDTPSEPTRERSIQLEGHNA